MTKSKYKQGEKCKKCGQFIGTTNICSECSNFRFEKQNKPKKRKARIIRYWQVVDENNETIDDAHSYQQALKIKGDYDRGKE